MLGSCTLRYIYIYTNTPDYQKKWPYDTADQSRNNAFLALLSCGEGWHNNHHFYPISARQGFFAWEIDLTYYLLKLLSLFGIVRDLRPVPAWVKEKGRS